MWDCYLDIDCNVSPYVVKNPRIFVCVSNRALINTLILPNIRFDLNRKDYVRQWLFFVCIWYYFQRVPMETKRFFHSQNIFFSLKSLPWKLSSLKFYFLTCGVPRHVHIEDLKWFVILSPKSRVMTLPMNTIMCSELIRSEQVAITFKLEHKKKDFISLMWALGSPNVKKIRNSPFKHYIILNYYQLMWLSTLCVISD